MKRLTKRIDGKAAFVHGTCYDPQQVCDFLAAYEDTGLEPEVCANYKQFEDEAMSKGVTFRRIVELMEAEKEGRLVVLPCKVGDTVYVLPNYSAYWDDIEETKITGVSQFPTKSGVSNQIVTSIGLCYEWERDFGVRLFYTRAEAEAALRNEQSE